MTGNVETLSEREKEMLRLLLKGHDAKSIARDLGLSVHTVNERLRTSRRKLEVSSSREAARLLAQSEESTPNFVVDRKIGIAGPAVHVNSNSGRSGRRGVKHPIVLAIGGTLIMSLIVATAMLTWLTPGDAEPAPLPNWSTATSVPENVPVRNLVRLDGHRLLWNGHEQSEATIRLYLDLITQLNPRPLLIFSYTVQTPPERIQRARLLIEKAIRCRPGDCLEIIPSSA